MIKFLCVAILFCLIQAKTAFIPNGGMESKVPAGPNCVNYVHPNGNDYKDGFSKQECKEKCEEALENKGWECQGMVFKSDNNRCWLKGPECDKFEDIDNDAKKGALYLEYDANAVYCEATVFGNKLTCNGAYSTEAHGLVGQVATLEECKAYCDQHDDCAYFFLGDNKNCLFYSECYVEDARVPSSNGATYKKGECPLDCFGAAFGDAEEDVCGVCDGDGSSCATTEVETTEAAETFEYAGLGELAGLGQSCDSFCATTGRTCNLEGTKVDSEDEFKAVYDSDECEFINPGAYAFTTSPSLEDDGECLYNSGISTCSSSWYDVHRWCVCDGEEIVDPVAGCCTTWTAECYTTASQPTNNFHACKDCGYAIEHCDNVCSSGSEKSGDLADSIACQECCQGYDHEVPWNCPAATTEVETTEAATTEAETTEAATTEVETTEAATTVLETTAEVEMCNQAVANPKDCRGSTQEDCEASPLSCITKFKNSNGDFKRCKAIKPLMCKNQETIEACDELCYCTTKLTKNGEWKKCKNKNPADF